MWHGTNAAGNPFELAGISLTTYDEDGLISYGLVTYPYSDEYVRKAFSTSGSRNTTPRHPWGPITAPMGYPAGRTY